MGNGKSRSIQRAVSGSSEPALSREDFDAIEKSVFNDLSSQKYDGIDNRYSQYFKDENVDIETEFDPLSDISDAIGEANAKELIKFAESSNTYSFSVLYDKLSNSKNLTKGQKDLLYELDDLGARSSARVSSTLSSIGKTGYSKVGIRDAGRVDSDTLNASANSALGAMQTLMGIAKKSGIRNPKKISFVDSLNTRAEGFYDPTVGGIHILNLGNEQRSFDRSGWSIGGSYSKSIAVHEYGHFIHDRVFRNAEIKGPSAVSTYGNTNQREAFAEAFAAYCFGVKPTRGKEYYKNFESAMSSKGLTGFKGCMK